MNLPNAKTFKGFAELKQHHTQGIDYKILVLKQASSIAVIAPHGGAIEHRTSDIARAIAANDFNLYLFEGIRNSDNYETLHLTSHYFDEPKCLKLIEACSLVITIHGCKGVSEKVLIGGLNIPLKELLATALRNAGITTETTDHPFPATEPNNICNRGATGKGVQLEFSAALRGGASEKLSIQAIRSALFKADDAANSKHKENNP